VPSTCRSDLATLDGQPLSVRISGDTAAAASGAALKVEACDAAGGTVAPIHLGAGAHTLRALPGTQTGLDLDSLVLASNSGGGALTLNRPVDTTTTPASGAPRIDVTSNGETTIRARVDGANGPFWLVLGESFNKGWKATVNGRDLGRPQLVDGMSNGWRVDPGTKHQLTVTLTWTPQSQIWLALAISGLAMLLCALLALFARRSRAGAGESIDQTVEFMSPFTAGGATPSRRAVISTTGAITVAGALLVTPWVGLVAGAATLAVLIRPRLRWLLAIGAPAALAVAGGYVVVQQSRHMYPAIFEWPTFFDAVHVVGWLAVILLAADAVVEVVRSRTASDKSMNSPA
jgi:hypothetical protein